jgi:LRRFIP family
MLSRLVLCQDNLHSSTKLHHRITNIFALVFQAEARLAARRQARAEAREIRMRELERQQKESEQTSDNMYPISPAEIKQQKQGIFNNHSNKQYNLCHSSDSSIMFIG